LFECFVSVLFQFYFRCNHCLRLDSRDSQAPRSTYDNFPVFSIDEKRLKTLKTRKRDKNKNTFLNVEYKKRYQ